MMLVTHAFNIILLYNTLFPDPLILVNQESSSFLFAYNRFPIRTVNVESVLFKSSRVFVSPKPRYSRNSFTFSNALSTSTFSAIVTPPNLIHPRVFFSFALFLQKDIYFCFPFVSVIFLSVLFFRLL